MRKRCGGGWGEREEGTKESRESTGRIGDREVRKGAGMELGRNKNIGRGRGKDRGEVKCPWEIGVARRGRNQVPLGGGGGKKRKKRSVPG